MLQNDVFSKALNNIPEKERQAAEYGSPLCIRLGVPSPVSVKSDSADPENWFAPLDGEKRRMKPANDSAHEHMACTDIHKESFSTYPAVKKQASQKRFLGKTPLNVITLLNPSNPSILKYS